MPPLTHLPRIGLGCWPLSGAMHMEGVSVGYVSCTDDPTAILTAAYDAGTRVFDTAQAYGAGHGEVLIGDTLQQSDIYLITKIGLGIDTDSRTITGMRLAADQVPVAIRESLSRLRRDHVDCVLLHPNEVPHDQAAAIFDALEAEVTAGTIGTYGWSTDYPDNAALLSPYPNARFVEHVMNVFLDAAALRSVTEPMGLTSFIRSPLAMGVLAGRFQGGETIAPGDVRVEGHSGMDWFAGNAAHPRFADRLAAIRDLLQTDGRSLAQGALCWLLAHGDHIIPVPGASSVAQAVSNAQAMEFGPLPPAVMAQITDLIPQETGPARAL